jgi:predicted dehydrogenase
MSANPLEQIEYKPLGPKKYRPRVGLIGCGGITQWHLRACQFHGLDVVALADVNIAQAEKRRDEFFPKAAVYTDPHELLARADIEVVDVATHVDVRPKLVRAALEARKHVLSQKPFVLDLDEGRALADLADKQGVRLAVNQNGRWAPYFALLLGAVRAGLIGRVNSLDLVMNWDHSGFAGTPFEKIHHLVLYDFAIHYFDIVANVFDGRQAQSVFANAVHVPQQTMAPPMAANAALRFDSGVATLSFSAHAPFGQREIFTAVGDTGTLRGVGNLCDIRDVSLHNADGEHTLALEGKWFPDGFRGTLGELLRAIEEDREPGTSARNNLRSLELCFGAMRSADSGNSVRLDA